jgi:15-cis-phytoene synthase
MPGRRRDGSRRHERRGEVAVADGEPGSAGGDGGVWEDRWDGCERPVVDFGCGVCIGVGAGGLGQELRQALKEKGAAPSASGPVQRWRWSGCRKAGDRRGWIVRASASAAAQTPAGAPGTESDVGGGWRIAACSGRERLATGAVSKPVTQEITRRSASNLALAFVLLPRERREAMSALYAFCREVDDVADEERLEVSERRRRLAAWREDIGRAFEGREPRFEVNRELQPVIARYGLPFVHFDELLRGVEMDLDIKRYGTYGELEQYCHRVASVVGLLSIEIFGYRNARCREYALALGRALQFTNILRDVGIDAARDRIYLPMEELERSGVRPEEILERRYSERFRELATRVARRAVGYYREAREVLPREDRRSMIAAELMGAVYWRLLGKLERGGFDVLKLPPTRLWKGQKLCLMTWTWLRLVTGMKPNYGLP